MVVCYHHLRKHPYVDNGNGWRLSPICCNKFPKVSCLLALRPEASLKRKPRSNTFRLDSTRPWTDSLAMLRWRIPRAFWSLGNKFQKEKKQVGQLFPFIISQSNQLKVEVLVLSGYDKSCRGRLWEKSVYQWWSVVANRKMTSFENLWCRNSSPSKPGNEHRIICWVKKLCTTWNAAIPEHAAFKRATQTRDTVSTVQVRRINFKNVGKVVKTKTSKNKVLALIFHQIGI